MQCFERGRGTETRNAKEVVPTTVPIAARFEGLLGRGCGLRQARQSIELTQYRNDGSAFAIARHECRWHAGDTPLDAETQFFGVVTQHFGGLRFFERDFRMRPDRFTHAYEFLALLID